MHPEEELDVCPEGVEMVILILVRLLLTLVVVSDTLTYLRGY